MKTKDFLLEPEPQQKLKFSDHYRQMWPFVKPYWIRALLAILICIPVGALDSVIALALKPYMDNVLVDKNTASPIYIPVLIVAFTTVQGFLNYAATYLNTWVGTRINHDLKRALFKKLMSFEPSFFDRNPSGVIIQRFAGDADTACLGLLDNLKLFVSRFFSSLSLIAVLIYNSWQLSIIAIVVLLCALLPLTQVKRRIKGLIKDTINRSSCILTHYNECHAGSKTIASYNLQERMYGQFNEILRTLFKLTMKMVKKTGWMTPLMHVVVSIGVGAVIGYGSYLIVNGTITSGNFVSFITALIMLYTPIKGIGKNFNNVQISFLAIERITDVLELESDIKDKDNALELKTVQKEIKFDHVNFEYQENVPVLRDICLNVKAGSTVALVGNSGGGKTTIVNLLPRFYDVKGGSVSIDGTDVRDYSLQSLRDKIAVVFQDNFLFSGTIRDNILLGNDVYGGTYRLLSKVFVPWGVGLDVVDITDTAAVSVALSQKQYRYIWVETPSNPLLNITDIAATSAVAHAHQSGGGQHLLIPGIAASVVGWRRRGRIFHHQIHRRPFRRGRRSGGAQRQGNPR